MKKVFIFHGYNSREMSHWMIWLEEKLRQAGVEVYFPAYNNSREPVMAEWLKLFESEKSKVDQETIFVAHSFGCLVTLKFLAELNITVSKVILVAPPRDEFTGKSLVGLLGKITETEKEAIIKFMNQKLDWDSLKSKSREFIFLLSKDDYAINFEESYSFYNKLFPSSDFKIYDSAGHFNHKAGIYEMPEVLDLII